MDALQDAGEPLTPLQIAKRTAMKDANVRKLLHGMRRAGLVAQSLDRSRPAYTLSDTDGNGGKDIVTAPDRGFTDATELPIDKPNRSVTAGEIFAYSERDGGSIPNAEHWRRKGYR